jgi:hypothetical protein
VALGVSTVATAIQADDEVILNISVVGIFLSLVLLSFGWHGDSKLQDATAEVTAKNTLLAEKDTTIASLNEKISKTADTTPAVIGSVEAVVRGARRAVGMLGLGRK